MKSLHFHGNRMNFKNICIISYLLSLGLVTGTNYGTEEKFEGFPHISKSYSSFSSDFFQVLTSEEIHKNVVSSPFSVHIILSMLLHGADGATRNELESALHLLDQHDFQSELKSLFTSLNMTEKNELKIVTAMYVDNYFALQKKFIKQCKDYFQTTLEKVNFENSAESVKKINTWVKESTKGKISHIINTDDIDSYTKVMLLNAVYFKSSWFDPFKAELTEKKIFYNIDGTEVYTSTMTKTLNIPHGYIKSLDCNFIKLKYLNTDFEMIIILPNEKYGLKNIEKNFNWELITKAPYSTKEVELLLPKFKIEATINLKSTLNKLGVKLMFEERANFSRMAEIPLHISQVLQKMFIEVDEKGSEVAVTVAAQMRARRMVIDYNNFIVDHPFMFIIQHTPSSIPLFIGSVRKLEETQIKDEL